LVDFESEEVGGEKLTRIFISREAIEQGEPPISVLDGTGLVRKAWAVRLHGPSEIVWRDDAVYQEELDRHVRVWVETSDRVTVNP
jgi:hypothetical protein